MKISSFEELATKCISIIKKNRPEESVKKIANLNHPKNNDKIGLNLSKELYELYSEYSINYDKKLYANNVSLYNKEIRSNIKKAKNVI